MIDDERRHGGARAGEDARAAQSRAILERIRQETEPQVGAGTAGMLRDVKGHFSARDVDPGDPIEVLGTRLGRLLGLLGFLILAMLLAAPLLYD